MQLAVGDEGRTSADAPRATVKESVEMIRYIQGDLLQADTEAVVNAVNTVGVMGKGIALAFKQTYPANFAECEAACKAQQVRTGCMFVTANRVPGGPRWIINFPTKRHWREPSRFEWIEEGLADLRRVILDHKIRCIAIPALGCGLGGLAWDQVGPAISAVLGDLEADIRVYEPIGRGTGKKGREAPGDAA